MQFRPRFGLDSPPETQFLHYYKVVEFFFSFANQHLLSEIDKNKENDENSKIKNEQRLIYLLNIPEVKEKACNVADADFFFSTSC